MKFPTKEETQQAINSYISSLATPLRELNQKIHEAPELAYEEHRAHDVICDFLVSQGIPTTRHAYGLSTAFEALVGKSPGRYINFNAEYDALPDIGHACGHNLIATASVAGFVALAFVIQKFGLPGQAQLLGTPAEEDGGGKIDLIRAGAYEKADISLMMHPVSEEEFTAHGVHGIGGRSSISCYDLIAVYRGVSAHAADSPWDGVNALDAVVSAYNNISMLRQQIHPTERIHGAILQAPTITNAIPELTRVKYTIRSPTVEKTRALGTRVRKCLEAAALATGCKIELEETRLYADLVVNAPLCKAFQEYMGDQGEQIWISDDTLVSASTDQGNVSQIVPALHAIIGVPVKDGAKNHTRQFTFAAGTDKAHNRTITAGKAMAMTGWKVLMDDGFSREVKAVFTPGKQN
ncbi:hypothetical protein N7448_004127 [Penicillium atrosanguineum]|uniref:uncharacterized protein n=1 Tax=Penicillium atrosanguineum TaxID=1132637 RepID=UPI00239A3E43|nr:uncharacterized protein N7443_003092 [Penicillium atrosanguineum]KAJ5117184.1 hypothetical protein N7526_011293 [Penicillium atrosanguineum]KAJ5140719.1 hypothetical protein N7448_004127 [Penicillium atrosanguineum]KAJ5310631.1 hypothetical protein N7443_003092 [Penicillium atrosanguineum]